jgi:hypothetical protein
MKMGVDSPTENWILAMTLLESRGTVNDVQSPDDSADPPRLMEVEPNRWKTVTVAGRR